MRFFRHSLLALGILALSSTVFVGCASKSNKAAPTTPTPAVARTPVIRAPSRAPCRRT